MPKTHDEVIEDLRKATDLADSSFKTMYELGVDGDAVRLVRDCAWYLTEAWEAVVKHKTHRRSHENR